MLSSFDDYWKYCRLCISPIPFLLFLCFLFSASSLKASFFSCFTSYYLLSRIKFGIRVRVLIVLSIKRSICLRLTLDWYKKKERTVLITKKNYSSSPPTNSRCDTQQIWKTLITACINADRKLCLNAGHTKTHGGRFSYRRPFPTPPTDRTKSPSAAPPQDHSRPAASLTIALHH